LRAFRSAGAGRPLEKNKRRRDRPLSMNNGITDTSPAERLAGISRAARSTAHIDELHQLKRELLQAEVRLAKARATAAGAEIDIKVLTARLKAFKE